MTTVNLINRIQHDFTLHPPTNDIVGSAMDGLRENFTNLAYLVANTTVPCREQSLALTKIEEGLFFAIAAIARNQEATIERATGSKSE